VPRFVYIRLYSLNNATALNFVTEWPDVTVLVEDVCRPQPIHTSPGLGQGWTLSLTCDFRVLLWMKCYTKCSELENNCVKKVFVK